MTELIALLAEPNFIVLPELEPVLVKAQRFDALCRLYWQYGQESKLLSTWAKYICLVLIEMMQSIDNASLKARRGRLERRRSQRPHQQHVPASRRPARQNPHTAMGNLAHKAGC